MLQNEKTSVLVQNISKVYKLYEKPIDRLIESFNRKKVLHQEYYALKDISFSVNQGETFGIIGTNGAGKSTLLKLITGVSTATSGMVQVNGKISALLELGAGFNPEYTGIENIFLNGLMMGYTHEEMEQKVDNILEFADIGEFIHQPVKTYSSGMFARLAFAVAINVEPEILIVDEALSVGDVFFQNKCYKKFEELKKKNTTIIFVSHDISTVKAMCSRVLWIEHGIQQMVGNSVDVCNAYANSILEKKAKKYVSLENEEESSYQIQKFDLEKYPTVSYSKESTLSDDVEILSCFIQDADGNITTDCEVNEEYTVSLIFESKKQIESCIAGFVVETIKGLWMINCNTAINGQKDGFKIEANTINRIEFKFMMPAIMNGDYILGVAISEGTMESYKVLTWLYDVISFRIHNTAQNSAVIDVKTEIGVYSNRLK